MFSDVVIVVSKEDERIGQKMWFLKNKIRYIPLAIGEPEFHTHGDAAKILPHPLDANPRVVSIAELAANKGIRYAIEAIAQLKDRGCDVSYYIIGDGEERERLAALAHGLQIANRVHFLGFVPDAARSLKAFDIYLLSSIKEGMPYVLLEAAAAGLSIVSTTVVDESFFESVPTAYAVRPADPAAIAEAITAILRPQSEKPLPLRTSLDSMLEKTVACYTTAPTISVSSRA